MASARSGAGKVRPEEQLGVAGHAALEAGAFVVIAGRDVVIDQAARGEQAAVAGPSQSEGQVDVLVIRAVERIEAAQTLEHIGTIERTRAAGAEDFFDGAAG